MVRTLTVFQERTCLLLLLVMCNGWLLAQGQRPNIIYIMTDDMGYADLSCYGRKDYQTPNLDKLASQGVKLMNAYSAAALCTPTRVAFMTGRYAARTPLGLKEPIEWNAKDSLVGLSRDDFPIAWRMQRAGYGTYLVGKWHLGFKPQFSPLQNGFDYFFGFNGGGVDYISHRSPDGGAPDLYENYEPVTMEGYMTDLLMKKSIEIINRKHDKPFFLNIMFNAPHWPWQAPGDKAYPDTLDWKRGGSPATYAGMMKSLDEAVGAIMNALDASQHTNTIVIFTNDNGGERFSDMGVYRGRKPQLWEGGIRVPAFVRWTGKIKPGTVSNQVLSTLDWTATILHAAGAKVVPGYGLDGMNVMPMLTGKKKEKERTIYWKSTQRADHRAMRMGKWKYMRDEKNVECLFDLEADPSEKTDLKEMQPGIFKKMKEMYAMWEVNLLKPIPL
jgi:arylsulfatase A-like enzyme